MKIPNFASLHQPGVGRLSIDSQLGSYRLASAASTFPAAIAHHMTNNLDMATSVFVEHPAPAL
jgi:hypothetical protein